MNAEDLIAAVVKAFPSSAGRIEEFSTAFRKVVSPHVGPTLAQAWALCLMEFKPGPGQPFPMPATLVTYLPAPADKAKGKAVDWTAHREAKAALMRAWWERQGNGIATRRGRRVAAACEHKSRAIAQLRAFAEEPEPVKLDVDEIDRTEAQVHAQIRLAVFGALPSHPGIWEDQMATARRIVLGDEALPGVASTGDARLGGPKHLPELANAHRQRQGFGPKPEPRPEPELVDEPV
jgi:hypothetical protein